MAKKTTTATEAEGTQRRRRNQVELDPVLARDIGIIAAALQMSVPDWVNNRLLPIVKEELPRVLRPILAPHTEKD